MRMMSITTATSVLTIRRWNTVRPTGMDTGNIKVPGQAVQRVHIWHNVPKAKTMSKRLPDIYGNRTWKYARISDILLE